MDSFESTHILSRLDSTSSQGPSVQGIIGERRKVDMKAKTAKPAAKKAAGKAPAKKAAASAKKKK